MNYPQALKKLLIPGIGVKRWLVLLTAGVAASAFGMALG
jgi:hypothetical protein